jgi:hypothetical protein
MPDAAMVFLLLSMMIFPSCKTTNPSMDVSSSKSEAKLEDHQINSHEIRLSTFSQAGCFNVASAESELTNQEVQLILQDTKKICVSELISGANPDKIIVELKAESNKILAMYRFKGAIPARCPGCYIFSGSKDGNATFSEPSVSSMAKLGLNLDKYDGNVSFMMLRELRDTAPRASQK